MDFVLVHPFILRTVILCEPTLKPVIIGILGNAENAAPSIESVDVVDTVFTKFVILTSSKVPGQGTDFDNVKSGVGLATISNGQHKSIVQPFASFAVYLYLPIAEAM
jgi:hypothetical protein